VELGGIDAVSGPRVNGRFVAWLTLVSILIASSWAARLTTSKPEANAAYDWNVAAGSVIQFLFVLGLIALIVRGDLGLLALRRPTSWKRALGSALGVLLLVAALNAAFEPLLHPGREQGLAPARWEPSHAGQFAVFAFAVVVLAPLTEELLFRGLGFSLLQVYGAVPPIVGTAILWGLAHGLLDALPILIPFGIGLAWMRRRVDSTIPGILLHGTFNALTLALSLTI
jgi:membrane protease YdiL (CAAX protease family)